MFSDHQSRVAMTVVLTICSANYLALAKTLGDSLTEHNSDYHFVIGLVDRIPDAIGPTYWQPYELIPVEALGIEGLAQMVQQYNIVELNTATKPFYIEYLYNRDPSVRNVIYLDPDILVLASLKGIEEQLQHSSIILTPHSCSYDDTEENINCEVGMLSTGTYNLGFIATARTTDTLAFLKWWQKRLRQHCYYRPGKGLFVDQYWLNLAPVYFRNVQTETNPGYNMCYWNLFERSLSQKDGHYVVNGRYELIFYHFSSYSPLKPELISNRPPMMWLADRPDLQPLFDEYRKRLLCNQHLSISSLECYFAPKQLLSQQQQIPPAVRESFLKGLSRQLLMALPTSAQRLLKRLAQFVIANTLGEHPKLLS
jgi:hypothetical protein